VSIRRRDVYPQYYRAKRRRERMVLGASIVVAAVIVIGFVALAVAYFLRPREGLEELAQRREEIVAPASEDVPAAQQAATQPQPAEEQSLLMLDDITEWETSVPELSLIPEGLGTGEPTPEEPPLPQITEEVAAAEEAEAPSDDAAEEEAEAEPSAPESEPEESAPEQTDEPESRPDTEPSRPATSPPADPQYTFTVLAGVYDSESEANRQRDRLLELGFQAAVLVRSYGDKKSYPVQVNPPLEEYELADAVKKRLREAGFSDAVVLRRDTGSR
jgi:cell division protein FtsN